MSYDPSLYYGHPFYYGRYGAMPTAQYSNGSYGQASAQSSYNFNAPGAPMMCPGNQGYSAYYPQSYYQQQQQYAATNPGMLNGHQMAPHHPGMAQQQVSMQYRSSGQMAHAQMRSSGNPNFPVMSSQPPAQQYSYSTAPIQPSARQMAPTTAPVAPSQPIAQTTTQLAPAPQPTRPTIPNPVQIPTVAPVSTITQDLLTDDHEYPVISRKRPTPVTTVEDQEPIQKKARVEEEAPVKIQETVAVEKILEAPIAPVPVEEIPAIPESPEPTPETRTVPMTAANKEFLDCLAELEESSSPESVKDSEADSDSSDDSDDVEDEEDSDCFGEISDSEDEEEEEVVFLTPKAKTPKVKKSKKRVIVMEEEEEEEAIPELDEYTKGLFEMWGLTYAPFKRSHIVSVVNKVVEKREAKGLTYERLPKRLRQ